jgi:ATP-dependent Clp protease ATP-binding subunit ClpC
MFETYTEKARRIIFYARYEASKFGSPYIEAPHLLLGLLRESHSTIRLVSSADSSTIRKAIEALCTDTGERLATSVDLPLSQPSKEVLTLAAEEAETMGHKHIGPEHLLLGMLRLQGPESATLAGFGIALETARKTLRTASNLPVAPQISKVELDDPRQALALRLLMLVPVDRLEAAIKILTAMRSPYFSASGVSSEGRFSFSFGEVPPAA